MLFMVKPASYRAEIKPGSPITYTEPPGLWDARKAAVARALV
jgi:hypothetical protein